MFHELMKRVEKELSGKHAKRYASEIMRFHRIQVTEGYNRAADRCKEIFEDNGIKTELYEYHSNGDRKHLGITTPEGWSIQKGVLTIDGDEYANFEKEPLSIIQRSIAFEGDVDLIYAEKEEDYEEGSLVFTHDFKKGRGYAQHHNCVGIVTDEHRSKFEIPDSLSYHSFWGEDLCGFVVSPRVGEKLEKELQKGKKNAHVEIDASLFPSKMKIVSARIEGETDEELLLIAHLCHPTPGGNDNASGVGLALELARVLNKFEKPKRGIRILLVPELHGTAAFISENREFLCGLNLDMVGQNQFLCKSPLLIEKTPDATPFFGNYLLEAILEEIKKETSNFSNTASYPLFMSSITPFSGGSDHWILSDPTIGIPTPMLIHWPDTFYHTSADTIDKMDEKELHRVGVLAATYLYFIADMGSEEAQWTARLMTQKAKERVVNAMLDSKDVAYIAEVEKKTVDSIYELEEIYLKDLKKEIDDLAASEKKRYKMEGIEPPEMNFIPKRKFPGPISLSKVLHEVSFEEKKEYYEKMEKYEDYKGITSLALFWVDGERDLAEIARRVYNEVGKVNTGFLLWYFEFLENHDLIEIKEEV